MYTPFTFKLNTFRFSCEYAQIPLVHVLQCNTCILMDYDLMCNNYGFYFIPVPPFIPVIVTVAVTIDYYTDAEFL